MADQKNRGLYDKFIVTRRDGQSAEGEKHDGCEYFVLDITHDPFALPALKAYADACLGRYPSLARDLYAMRDARMLKGVRLPGDLDETVADQDFERPLADGELWECRVPVLRIVHHGCSNASAKLHAQFGYTVRRVLIVRPGECREGMGPDCALCEMCRIEGYERGKTEAAPPPAPVATEVMVEAAKFARDVLAEQRRLSREAHQAGAPLESLAQAIGIENIHRDAHGVTIALCRLDAALRAGGDALAVEAPGREIPGKGEGE